MVFRRKHPRFTEEDSKIIELYNQGSTTENIVKTMGIGVKTIRKKLRYLGLSLDNMNKRGRLEGTKKLKENFKERNKEQYNNILELYNQGNTIVQISNITKKPRCTIGRILGSLGVTIEERKKHGNINGLKNRINTLKEKKDKENKNILDLYNEDFLIKDISKEVGLGINIITKRLNELGTDKRERMLRGLRASAKFRERNDIPNEEIINLYANKKMSSIDISKHFNCSSTLVLGRLEKLGIGRRDFKLENNPNWLDGISFEPYDIKFNKEFKNLIRLRDNFCCINCGISEQKHFILTRKRLSVHHVDYDKKNTCLYNCCTLCISCNVIANKNRNYWTEYYQEKLSRLYYYKYKLLEIKNE